MATACSQLQPLSNVQLYEPPVFEDPFLSSTSMMDEDWDNYKLFDLDSTSFEDNSACCHCTYVQHDPMFAENLCYMIDSNYSTSCLPSIQTIFEERRHQQSAIYKSTSFSVRPYPAHCQHPPSAAVVNISRQPLSSLRHFTDDGDDDFVEGSSSPTSTFSTDSTDTGYESVHRASPHSPPPTATEQTSSKLPGSLSTLPLPAVRIGLNGMPIRRRREKSRTPHLWKFMRALLESSDYNPWLIRWENRSEGVFRIVPGQSKHVATLWGLKKKNPSMTFDKLSRSLRWCRKFGFLDDVPKDKGYPKKLCFRFAEFALNWQPDSTVTLPLLSPTST